MLNIYLNVKDQVTNRQCQISYRRPPQLRLSRPCGSIAYPLPNIFQLVDTYRSVSPASCTVVEVDGRRVRIDEPIGGWCSIESSNGDLILSPTNEERDDGAAGLAGGAADQGRVGALEKELQELKWLREEVAAKN